MTTLPLIKFLSAAGNGSRRIMAAAIKRGAVKVNGDVAANFIQPVDTQKDVITLDGKRITQETTGHVYLMLNKPKGVVSTTESERGDKTVLDLIPEKYRTARVFPIGRLDKDSTGLIILTNDGELTYQMSHPRFKHEKEYLVQIANALTGEQKKLLEQGIELTEGKTAPAKIRSVKMAPYNYSIVIHEGRKRQIRRMFAALSIPVIELKRIRIGGLQMGTLTENKIRELKAAEIKLLRSA